MYFSGVSWRIRFIQKINIMIKGALHFNNNKKGPIFYF